MSVQSLPGASLLAISKYGLSEGSESGFEAGGIVGVGIAEVLVAVGTRLR